MTHRAACRKVAFGRASVSSDDMAILNGYLAIQHDRLQSELIIYKNHVCSFPDRERTTLILQVDGSGRVGCPDAEGIGDADARVRHKIAHSPAHQESAPVYLSIDDIYIG